MDTYFVCVLDDTETIEELFKFDNAVARARAANEARKQTMGIYRSMPPYERLEAIVHDGSLYTLADYEEGESA